MALMESGLEKSAVGAASSHCATTGTSATGCDSSLARAWLSWLIGLALAGLIWTCLFVWIPRDHDAADGIVGAPAQLNYSERRESILLFAAHLLPVLMCGITAFGLRQG